MKVEERRAGIIKTLTLAKKPVSASSLAEEYGVSRQIIVKDIATLRESGFAVTSYARGYLLEKESKYERVFKLIHSDEETEEELNIIVDLGGVIKDVFVYHKFYNKLSARMDIKSRLDIKKFMDDITSGKSSLLKNVTSGYHYHTVCANNDITLNLIQIKLKERGFLAPLQEYEPTELGIE
ncbi:MAG: transcription repressor NadR [Eubacteriales bacterium]|nr:transcription repressor NadR [Eubacteriales bacterium]